MDRSSANDRRVLLERQIPSDRAFLAEIPERLEEIRQECDLGQGEFYNLVIAVTEAVGNAIRHGNQENPEKSVRYLLYRTGDSLYCEVWDEGSGFDPDALNDPVSPEHLLEEGGRGVFIIRSLMKDFEVIESTSGSAIRFRQECR